MLSQSSSVDPFTGYDVTGRNTLETHNSLYQQNKQTIQLESASTKQKIKIDDETGMKRKESQHQRIQWIQVAQEVEELSTSCSSIVELYCYCVPFHAWPPSQPSVQSFLSHQACLPNNSLLLVPCSVATASAWSDWSDERHHLLRRSSRKVTHSHWACSSKATSDWNASAASPRAIQKLHLVFEWSFMSTLKQRLAL